MNSSYKYRLEKLQGKEVTIHRAGAPDVTGEVVKVEEAGCEIKQAGSRADSANFVFIAYEDIRGIAHEDWDLDGV